MKPQDIASQILYADHPSFGTERAVFLFALGTGPTRILSVEASNPWAVMCMERLLLADGKASKNCRVLQVVREYKNVGTRDEMAEEIPFVDFMLDIADMDKLLGEAQDDALVLEAFKNALSDAERHQAMLKLRALQELPEENIFDNLPGSGTVPAAVEVLPAVEDQADKLTSALVGLGFKKPEVRRFVASLGDETRTLDMHSLLRKGLQALAA